MARPRIFVSSTYYDLKHIRASLDVFIQSLGYESVLSEKGDIAYAHDRPLDESCYKEAESSDIFLLIVGGRYGSEASENKRSGSKGFFERYDSITKKEYETAHGKDIPIYILVESGVHSEYLTYQRNKDNNQINYAHVDSVNVFKLLDEIFSLPRNNPTKTFERFSDIEAWLRDQWAGLFRDLLSRESEQKQLSALGVQIARLADVNETLRKYLEAVVTETVDNPGALISSEKKRLEEARIIESIKSNRWFKYTQDNAGGDIVQFVDAMRNAESYESFVTEYTQLIGRQDVRERLSGMLKSVPAAQADFNRIRSLLGMKKLPMLIDENESEDIIALPIPVVRKQKNKKKPAAKKARKVDS